MDTTLRQGKFEVIESFAIKTRNEFYLIGEIKQGIAKENWFLNVPFNNSLSMSVRISAVEEIVRSNEHKAYKLLIVSGDEETIDLLLGLKIGNEYLDITVDGKD